MRPSGRPPAPAGPRIEGLPHPKIKARPPWPEIQHPRPLHPNPPSFVYQWQPTSQLSPAPPNAPNTMNTPPNVDIPSHVNSHPNMNTPSYVNRHPNMNTLSNVNTLPNVNTPPNVDTPLNVNTPLNPNTPLNVNTRPNVNTPPNLNTPPNVNTSPTIRLSPSPTPETTPHSLHPALSLEREFLEHVDQRINSVARAYVRELLKASMDNLD